MQRSVRAEDRPPALLLGGPAALAEGAWMGAAQASDVLDQLRTAPRGPALPRLRRPALGSLFTAELTVAQATVVLAASFFFSAMLGAVRQTLFNAEFGAGSDASAYYAAFRLPDTLFSLIAGGALSSAMIPVLLATARSQGHEAALRLTRLVLTTLLVAFAVVVAVGEALAGPFVNGVLAPGFDGETSALAVNLTRIMLLQPLILAAGSVAIAVLNSRNQFLLTALSVVSHNVALIAGIVAAKAFPELGIYGPALGVVGGGVLQVLIVLPGLREGGGMRPVWAPHDPNLRELVKLLIPNGLAVGVGYAGFIVDTAFASQADEPEALAAVLNAWLLVGLPIALLGQAVGQAAFPRLAAAAADADWGRMRRTLLLSLGAVAGLAVPALLGCLFLGRATIRVLFEHGEFGAVAGDLTFDVLAVYALGLPAYVATEVVTRGLIALRDTRTPLLTNAVQLAGRAGLVAMLLNARGAVAIAIAFAVTASIETVVLGAVLTLRLRSRMRGGAGAELVAAAAPSP